MRNLIDLKENSINKRSEFISVVLYVSVVIMIATLALLLVSAAA